MIKTVGFRNAHDQPVIWYHPSAGAMVHPSWKKSLDTPWSAW
jgi:hypothetical protein